jgi:hypothetical protein
MSCRCLTRRQPLTSSLQASSAAPLPHPCPSHLRPPGGRVHALCGVHALWRATGSAHHHPQLRPRCTPAPLCAHTSAPPSAQHPPPHTHTHACMRAPATQVLQAASERVFVPLTVGGGIRGFSAAGQTYPALQVASEYFRCVCDSVIVCVCVRVCVCVVCGGVWGCVGVCGCVRVCACGGGGAQGCLWVYGGCVVSVAVPRARWLAPALVVRLLDSSHAPARARVCVCVCVCVCVWQTCTHAAHSRHAADATRTPTPTCPPTHRQVWRGQGVHRLRCRGGSGGLLRCRVHAARRHRD